MCADTAAACAWTAAWLRDRWGLAATTTLRLTSPQAAMVSIIAALIACIVALSRVLITPWNWNAWRVVMRRRSEEHTSELQSLMRTSYAVFCLKKKNDKQS